MQPLFFSHDSYFPVDFSRKSVYTEYFLKLLDCGKPSGINVNSWGIPPQLIFPFLSWTTLAFFLRPQNTVTWRRSPPPGGASLIIPSSHGFSLSSYGVSPAPGSLLCDLQSSSDPSRRKQFPYTAVDFF